MAHQVLLKTEQLQWVDVEKPTEEDFNYLETTFGINEMHLEDATDPSHLPKYEFADGVLFLLMREHVDLDRKNLNGIHDVSTKLSVFLVENTIITVHRMKNPSIETMKKEVPMMIKEDYTRDDVALRIALLILESFDKESQRLVSIVDEIETGIFLQNQLSYNPIKRLYKLKRKSGLNARVLSLSTSWIQAFNRLDIDDVEKADLFDKQRDVISDFEHLNNQIQNMISMYIALSDQKANQVMKLLAIYSVYFLPITFIAGLYGMNFEYMPELKQPHAYFITLGVMLLIVLITFIFFKKKKF